MKSDVSLFVTCTIANTAPELGHLKLHGSWDYPSLEFFPETVPPRNPRRFSQIPSFTYRVCELLFMEVSDDTQYTVRISDGRWTELSFDSADDLLIFTEFLQKRVTMHSSEVDRRVFSLEQRIDGACYTGNRTLTFLHTSNNQRVSWYAMMRALEKQGLYCGDNGGEQLCGVAESVLSGEQLRMLIANWNMRKTRCECSTDVLEQRERYLKIKKQWMYVTKRQFQNWSNLEEQIIRLEKLVDDCCFLFDGYTDGNKVMEMVFNILLTYSLWCWNSCYYIHNYMKILSIFFNCFIKDVIEDFAIGYNDERMSFNDSEADIFWCLVGFIDILKYDDSTVIRQPMLKDLFQSIGSVIFEKIPILNAYLNQIHVFSLDFLFDDCINWFFDCFNNDDNKKILISALTFPDMFNFFQCFTLSFLISLITNFEYIYPIDFDEFLNEYHKLKHKMNLNTILSNTKKCINLFTEQS